MISRRALLGTGAATAAVAAGLGVAGLTHRLDDLARLVGVTPHPESDPGDERLIAEAAAAQAALLATVEATVAAHKKLQLDRFVTISRAHLEAVGRVRSAAGVVAPPTDPTSAVRALAHGYAAASRARTADAGRAVSPDLARVLASMSAGLAQCAATIVDVR